jgi:hypothetical protein
MKNKGRWLLTAVVLCCLAPGAFARKDKDKDCHRCGIRVPEGGSTAIYLLGAGLTCFGAMFLRSKVAKPAQS